MPFDTHQFAEAVVVETARPERAAGRGRARERAKRVFDLALGLAVLPVIAVMVGLLYLVVRAVDGHPVFFSQMRVGRGGVMFRCWKLRTMTPDAEARLENILARDPEAAREWRETQKLQNDPRVTRLGRILRKTSLDELPQLYNVLRGEMSLVGPRPIVRDEISRYGEDFDFYSAVRPGVTGLWQVSGRSAVSYERRVELDRRYAETWTIGGDVLIILKTAGAVLSGRGSV